MSDDITNVGRRGFLGGLAALGVAPKVVAESLVGKEKTSLASGIGNIVSVHGVADSEGKADGGPSFYDMLKDQANGYYNNRLNLANIWREELEKLEKANPQKYTSYKEAMELINAQFKSFGAAKKHEMALEIEKNSDYDIWFNEIRMEAWTYALDIWENRLENISLFKLKDSEVQRIIIDSYRYLMDNAYSGKKRYTLSSLAGYSSTKKSDGYEDETSMLEYIRKNPKKYPNIMKIDSMFGDIIKNWL